MTFFCREFSQPVFLNRLAKGKQLLGETKRFAFLRPAPVRKSASKSAVKSWRIGNQVFSTDLKKRSRLLRSVVFSLISTSWRKRRVKFYNLQPKAKNRHGLYKTIVFNRYRPDCLSKLLEKLVSFVRYRYCGKMWRRQSTTEILKRRENFKRSDIRNKIYKKPVSASQL